MGLRLAEGIAPESMATRFGMTRQQMLDDAAIDRLIQMGFLTQSSERLIVTRKGMPLLDAILPEVVSLSAVEGR